METIVLNTTHNILLTRTSDFEEITKRGFHLFYWDKQEMEENPIETKLALLNAINKCCEYPFEAIDIVTKGIVFNHSDLAYDIGALIELQMELETIHQKISIEKTFEEQFADINPFAIEIEGEAYWYETDELRDSDWEQLCWLLTINSVFHKYSVE